MKINKMASHLNTRPFSEYKVGEISQALLTKNTTKKNGSYGNEKLDALFSSARSFQPEFVPITPKVRGHVCTGLQFRDWSSTIGRHSIFPTFSYGLFDFLYTQLDFSHAQLDFLYSTNHFSHATLDFLYGQLITFYLVSTIFIWSCIY